MKNMMLETKSSFKDVKYFIVFSIGEVILYTFKKILLRKVLQKPFLKSKSNDLNAFKNINIIHKWLAAY